MSDTVPPPSGPQRFPRPSWSPSTEPSRANRPVAAWLAIAGSGLLLVAAVVVVASRWEQIPQAIRFTGLLTALVLIAALAEHARRWAPTTARVIAHLVPGIAVTVGTAAGATLAERWPVCIIIGGLLGVTTTEVQKRRWASPRMAIIAVGGLILAASGVAADIGIPVALIAAGSAGVLLLCRRELEAVSMAVAVAASPVLATLTTLKFGDGTMTRIGAAGPSVAWSAPIAGLVAAAVLGILAHRQRSRVWAGAAVASGVLNVVAGLAVGGASRSLWACLVPAVVIAVELGADTPAGIWRDLCSRASRHIALPASYGGLTFAAIMLALWSVPQVARLSSWSMPLAFAGLAIALVGARRLTSQPSIADLAIAGSIACAAAAIATTEASSLAVSGVALAGLLFCFVVRRPSLEKASLVSGACLALTLMSRATGVAIWTTPAAIDLALTVVGGLLCLAVALQRKAARQVPLVVLAIAGMVAAMVAPEPRLAVGTATLAVLGAYCTIRRPQLAIYVAAITAATAYLQIDDLRWSAVAAVTASGAVALVGRRTPWLRVAAGAQFVAAGWLAVRVAGATPDGVVGWMIVAGIVLTGIAFSTPALTELDAAGLAATLLAASSSMNGEIHPAFISLVLIVGSAQGLAYGVARRQSSLATASAAIGGLSILSLWFTTGTNAAVLSSLARYDFTGADLAALAAGAAMLVVGIGIRSWQRVSTWLAYGPGLAMLSAWVSAVDTSRRADWSAMAGLLIGIAAIAVGGWKRMGAPLVIGTALLTTTVLIASGGQLASLPGWTWLVLGGIVLLGLAAMIERRTNGDGDASGGLKSMFERFS
jgi:hypothetical protein